MMRDRYYPWRDAAAGAPGDAGVLSGEAAERWRALLEASARDVDALRRLVAEADRRIVDGQRVVETLQWQHQRAVEQANAMRAEQQRIEAIEHRLTALEHLLEQTLRRVVDATTPEAPEADDRDLSPIDHPANQFRSDAA